MKEQEIRVYDTISGILLCTLYRVDVHKTENIPYMRYNGIKYPIMYTPSEMGIKGVPYVFMYESEVNTSDLTQRTIQCKKVIDLEHIRQLCTDSTKHFIGIDINGCINSYSIKWVKKDRLGYSNVLTVIRHYYGHETVEKVVLSYDNLNERLPQLADSLACGTLYQVQGLGDVYSALLHTNVKIEVVA